MHTGKYIFSQIVEYIPRYEYDKIVAKYRGDFHAKDLNSYNHLLHLLFGQLTACSSLRDICLCLKAHPESLYHLGFRQTVNPSSLSRANEKRDYRIFEELGYALINIVRPKYQKNRAPNVFLPGYELFALDSTTISTSIVLASWALGKYSKGAVKMLTLLDLRGSIPVEIFITDGKWHDSNALDVLDPVPFGIYMMDKAYVGFEALFRINTSNAYYVTRPKDNMKYAVVETNHNIDPMAGIVGDYSIRLIGYAPRKLYPENIRMVVYHDDDNDVDTRFITNNFELGPLGIANLYKNRWNIEIFFKWIKQNLTIKKLWGYSKNAANVHLWAAICAYLLVARIKADCNCSYSVTEVATLLGVCALEKIHIRELLAKHSDKLNSTLNVIEPNLFNW